MSNSGQLKDKKPEFLLAGTNTDQSQPPVNQSPTPAAPPACIAALSHDVRNASDRVRAHLNDISPAAHPVWWQRVGSLLQQIGSGQNNPVRVKNLEKVLAHLQVLQTFLADPNLASHFSPDSCDILSGLLAQLNDPKQISFNNAWEIADLLEGELLRVGDLTYIKGIWLTWPRSRVPDTVQELVVKADLDDTSDTGVLLKLVQPWLLEDQRDLVQEYRRDRAMIALRRSYLNIMGVTLLVLDLIFAWLFITGGKIAAQEAPGAQLLLIMITGAIGSILARATKLSQQPLPSEATAGKGQEMPLGIRSLMTTWSVFWAQVALGATAALIVFLVFSSGLLKIKGLDAQTPTTLAVLAFIAGFSEPFLLDVVGKISGRVV